MQQTSMRNHIILAEFASCPWHMPHFTIWRVYNFGDMIADRQYLPQLASSSMFLSSKGIDNCWFPTATRWIPRYGLSIYAWPPFQPHLSLRAKNEKVMRDDISQLTWDWSILGWDRLTRVNLPTSNDMDTARDSIKVEYLILPFSTCMWVYECKSWDQKNKHSTGVLK